MAKYYLCVDLKNTNEKIETCYLYYGELKDICKFTSYCTDGKMLLNCMPHGDSNARDLIQNNLLSFPNNNTFYIKKTKSDKQKIPVLYKKDEDVVYITPRFIAPWVEKNYHVADEPGIQATTSEKKKTLYNMMSDMIKGTGNTYKINNNFDDSHDSDKGITGFQNVPFWCRIAIGYDNIPFALRCICNEFDKKMEFLLFLKKDLKVPTLLENGLLENIKVSVNAKEHYSANNIKKVIEGNVYKFFNFKKIESQSKPKLEKKDSIIVPEQSDDDMDILFNNLSMYAKENGTTEAEEEYKYFDLDDILNKKQR